VIVKVPLLFTIIDFLVPPAKRAEEPSVRVPPELTVNVTPFEIETFPINLASETVGLAEIDTLVPVPDGTVPVLQFDPTFQFPFVLNVCETTGDAKRKKKQTAKFFI
jgi:hypothetical protein